MERRLGPNGRNHRRPEVTQLDLGLLLVRARKAVILTEPFSKTFEYLKSLRRWEEKNHCLMILIYCNFSCIIIPSAYNLVLVLTVLSFLTSMGFMHRQSQCLVKVFPNSNIKQEDVLGGEGLVTHNDVMKHYKAMLFRLDALLESCINHLNQFYSILKWDNLEVSVRSYGWLTLIIIFLHLLPLRWSVTMVINVFLLEHKVATFFRESSLWAKLSRHDDSLDKSDSISVDSQDSPSTDLETLTFNPPEMSDSEGSDGEKADTSGVDNDSDIEFESLQLDTKPSSSKGSVVGKILEFKKKHQSAAGNCVGCNVQFSTILKRRHICSHCGNHFCSRCCSHKVPRSMFGATSPAAQTETVPVCGFCNMYLTGKKDPALQNPDDKEKEKDAEHAPAKEKDEEQETQKSS